MKSLPVVLCVLLAGGGSLAQEATAPEAQREPEPPRAPEPPTPPQAPRAPESPGSESGRPVSIPLPSEASPAAVPAPAVESVEPPNLDFNLLPEQPAVPLDPTLEGRIQTRRTMLVVHQALGIATVALLATSVVFGQLNYDDRFGGGPNLGTYALWHSSFSAAATLTFTASGLLALLAPVPLEKRGGVDTITIHKWSMLVATLGFATEIVLGIYAASREGYLNQASLAETHLVIGYVTTAAVGVGTVALFF